MDENEQKEARFGSSEHGYVALVHFSEGVG